MSLAKCYFVVDRCLCECSHSCTVERTLSAELAGAPYTVSEGAGLLTVCVVLLGIEVPENTSASVDLSSANASASGEFQCT